MRCLHCIIFARTFRFNMTINWKRRVGGAAGGTCIALMGFLSFFGLARADQALDVGVALPALTVLDQDGSDYDLAASGKEGYFLVYFYPKADTPGCTKQACSLRDSYAKLTDLGVKVVGVSGDKPESQKAFKEKYELPFTLLADTEGKVADAFGVPRLGPLPKRQAYLFKDGKLVWRDLSASTAQQAEDVLAYIATGQASGGSGSEGKADAKAGCPSCGTCSS